MDTDFGAACAAKETECKPGVNDFCAESVLYLEASVAAGRACLAEPCTSVSSCLERVFYDEDGSRN